LAQELANAEQALCAIALSEAGPSSSPAKADSAAALEKLVAGLRSTLTEAQKTQAEAGHGEAFQLTAAEKLLTRHKYEVSGDVLADGSISLIRAKDINIERTVAMKVVRGDVDGREAAISQLIAEARMIGRLEHPNIQPVYDLSIDETGRAFYTAKM